jgi:hypothetical protein
MTPDEVAALDLVIERTRVERYRHLCSEANTLPPPNAPADWRAWVVREAGYLRGKPRPVVEPDAAPSRGCGGCPGSPLAL